MAGYRVDADDSDGDAGYTAFQELLAERERALVSTANEILKHLGIAIRLDSFEDCTPALWVSLFEGLFETRLLGIKRDPDASDDDKVRNVAIVLRTLERRVLFQDLSHLSAWDICEGGDIVQVMDLLEIFAMLMTLDVEGRRDGRGKLSEQWTGFMIDNSYELGRHGSLVSSAESASQMPTEERREAMVSFNSSRHPSPTTPYAGYNAGIYGADASQKVEEEDVTSGFPEDPRIRMSGDYDAEGYFNDDTMPSTIHGEIADDDGSAEEKSYTHRAERVHTEGLEPSPRAPSTRGGVEHSPESGGDRSCGHGQLDDDSSALIDSEKRYPDVARNGGDIHGGTSDEEVRSGNLILGGPSDLDEMSGNGRESLREPRKELAAPHHPSSGVTQPNQPSSQAKGEGGIIWRDLTDVAHQDAQDGQYSAAADRSKRSQIAGAESLSRNASATRSTPNQRVINEMEQFVLRQQRRDVVAGRRTSTEGRQGGGDYSEEYEDIDSETDNPLSAHVPRRRVQRKISKAMATKQSTPSRRLKATPKTPQILQSSPCDTPHTKALKLRRTQLLREARARDLLAEEAISESQALITVEALRLAVLRSAPLTASRGFPRHRKPVRNLYPALSAKRAGAASRGGGHDYRAGRPPWGTAAEEDGDDKLEDESSSGGSHIINDDDLDLLPYVRDVKTFRRGATSRFPAANGRKMWRQIVDTRRRIQDRFARQLSVKENRVAAELISLEADLNAQLAQQEAVEPDRWTRRKVETANLRTAKRILDSRHRRTVRLAKRQMDADDEASAAELRRTYKEEKVVLDLYHDLLREQRSVARDMEKLRRDRRNEDQEREREQARKQDTYWREQLRLVGDQLRRLSEGHAEAARAQEQMLRRLQKEQKEASREAIRLSRERLDADSRDATDLERDAEDARRRLRLNWQPPAAR